MFKLPESTIISKVLPKNTFHKYANARQKKALTNKVEKIIWEHKLSRDTINLEGEDIEEIQIFHIQLKEQNPIEDILKLIDRSIPYHIINVLSYNQSYKISASKKHPHPTNEDQGVIDWTFTSEWIEGTEPNLNFNLKKSLDDIFNNVCFQVAGKDSAKELNIEKLIEEEQELKYLNMQIDKLETRIKNCKQFNKKVDLNLVLNKLLHQLEDLSSIG